MIPKWLSGWRRCFSFELLALVALIIVVLMAHYLGSYLEQFSWFWIPVLIFVLAALATAVSMRSFKPRQKSLFNQGYWGTLIFLFFLVLLLALQFTHTADARGLACPLYGIPASIWGPVLVGLVFAVAFSVWFVTVFSREVTPGQVAREADIIPMVRFCYVFTIVAFGASLTPLLAILFVHDPTFYLAMARSPIGLVKGCVHYPDDPHWELACSPSDPYKAQWMINLGGSTRFTYPMPAVAGGTASATPTEAPLRTPTAIASYTPGATHSVTPVATTSTTSTAAASATPTVTASTPTATPSAAAAPGAVPTMDAVDLLIRADGTRPPVIVHGGLAVPWYFIALAIMGAAVGLARKIPEYQRRAISPVDTLDGATAREYFEFQVLQVLSAPLIALAAYNLFPPTGISTSAALGFSAGFSSETILLAIRGLMDRVTATPGETSTAARDDSTIAKAVSAALHTDDELLRLEPDLKVSQIKVEVKDGVVTLSGALTKAEAVKRAEDVAKAVPGVTKTENKLTS